MTDPTFLAAITSVATFVFAAGSPGPATLAVSATAMAGGRARSMALAAGLTFGLAFWGGVVALGFGALVAESAAILTVLKLIGAGYLLYLAIGSGRAALRPAKQESLAPLEEPAGRLMRRGLFLNLSNPKAVLAWVAALALGTEAASTSVVSILIVVICAMLGGVIYIGYATLFSLAPVMAWYQRFRRWIEGVFAALFAGAALRLLVWRGAE